jgi:hypothetical protein
VIPSPVAPAPLLGSTTPRLYRPPLALGPPGPCGCGCALTGRSSRGFEAVQFATDVLGVQLLPWQRWWLIHALETVPGSGPGTRLGRRLRFRVVLTLVARQQGKSTLLMVVSLYFMALRYARLVLGSAQALDIADECWRGALELAEESEALAPEVTKVIRGNGKTSFTLAGARYRTVASSRSAGRGLPVGLLLLDELREQRDWLAWGALSKTTMAQPGALLLPTSNAGDAESVVLNSLRAQALAGADDTLTIMEWSAPDGCELDDVDAWRQAMPGLGITIEESAVRSALATDPPEVFRTELLCQHVDVMDSAITPDAWKACQDAGGSLAGVRNRIVMVLDAAPDGRHVTALLAAPVGKVAAIRGPGGAGLDVPIPGAQDLVRVEVAGAWDSTDAAMAALPDLVEAIRPRALGWYPLGPGAVLSADLERLYDYSDPSVKRRPRYAPDLVKITGADVTASCQGVVDMIATRRLLQPNDPLLNSQAIGAQRKDGADGGFRFVRVGAGSSHVDAVYAMAGAVHIARTLPPPQRRPMVY